MTPKPATEHVAKQWEYLAYDKGDAKAPEYLDRLLDQGDQK